MFIYAICWYVPDVMDKVENQVENYTGYTRNYLPKNLITELNYLNFSKTREDDKEFVYYYKLEESNIKRLVLITASPDSNAMIGDIIVENIIIQSESKKIYSLTVYPNQEVPLIVVQSTIKPFVYVGIPK